MEFYASAHSSYVCQDHHELHPVWCFGFQSISHTHLLEAHKIQLTEEIFVLLGFVFVLRQDLVKLSRLALKLLGAYDPLPQISQEL